MSKKLIIAIDGPAGSGKSTVTHLLAKRLSYCHIDTGAIYRAVAYQAIQKGGSLEDGSSLGKLAASCNLEFRWVDEKNHIFLNNNDLGLLIRTPEISAAASKISAYPEVRQALLGLQRKLGQPGGVVLEGRDIGTVVFPNADLKFYLIATVECRAQRRMNELVEKGNDVNFEEVKRQVIERDQNDMTRKVAPLRKAEDAIEIDTTNMTVEQVVVCLESFVKKYETSAHYSS